jgi:hypothetical protein
LYVYVNSSVLYTIPLTVHDVVPSPVDVEKYVTVLVSPAHNSISCCAEVTKDINKNNMKKINFI